MSTTTRTELLKQEAPDHRRPPGDQNSVVNPNVTLLRAAEDQSEEEREMDGHREIQDVFMSPEEVMLYLKIGRTKCYEILQTSVPSYAVGRLRRVKKSDIDRWLESQRYAPWE